MSLSLPVTAVSLLALLPRASAQTLTNASFESPFSAPHYGNTGWTGYIPWGATSSFSFTGWSATRSGTGGAYLPDVMIVSSFGSTAAAADGSRFLLVASDSTDSADWPMQLNLKTNVSGLESGLIYEVSFYYKATLLRGETTWSADLGTWQAYAGSSGLAGATTYHPFDATPVSSALDETTDWTLGSYRFTAAGATDTLHFVGVVSGDPAALFLDGLTIKQVPEPASALLCGAGALALLLRRSRR